METDQDLIRCGWTISKRTSDTRITGDNSRRNFHNMGCQRATTADVTNFTSKLGKAAHAGLQTNSLHRTNRSARDLSAYFLACPKSKYNVLRTLDGRSKMVLLHKCIFENANELMPRTVGNELSVTARYW